MIFSTVEENLRWKGRVDKRLPPGIADVHFNAAIAIAILLLLYFYYTIILYTYIYIYIY